MEYPKITVVDETDTVVTFEDYPVAIEKGLIRRISCVYVFDTQGRLLVQLRSAHVRSPHLYDCSASGHVDEGESYEDAAKRELKEEIGIDAPLQEVVLSYRTSECFNGVYRAVVPEGTKISFDTHEIDDVKWMMPEEVDILVSAQPPTCVDAFIQEWTELRDTLIT